MTTEGSRDRYGTGSSRVIPVYNTGERDETTQKTREHQCPTIGSRGADADPL